MSYWDNLLALSPDVLWLLDEASGTDAADSSGNDYPGAYVNTPALGEDSLIAAEPDSTSVLFDNAAAEYVRRYPASSSPYPLTPTDTFTALVWIKPTNLAASRDVISMVNSWQMWIETDGKLYFHCTPAWTSLLSTAAVSAGAVSMVALRKTPTTIDILINGVQRGTTGHTSNLLLGDNDLRVAGGSSAGGRNFHGTMQGFAYWVGTALSDEQLLDLYTAGASEPPPPPSDLRITQDVTYVPQTGGPRITLDVTYSVHGPNERRITLDATYIVVLDPMLPGTPAITVDDDSPTEATVTVGTPGSNADDHALYVALSPTGIVDATNLYADSLGATPSPIPVTGLTPGLVYYFVLVAINDAGSTASAAVSLEMPAVTAPTLAITGRTDSGATAELRNVLDADADEVRYETAAAADTEYVTLLDDSTVITEDTEERGRFVYPITGQEAATDLRTRVSWRQTGGAWSSLEVEWATLAEPIPEDILSHWESPDFGEVISGTYCARFAVELGRTVADILIEADDDGSWSSVTGTLSEYRAADAGFTYWQICFDADVYADGWYRLRLLLDDGVAVDHYGFRIGGVLGAFLDHLYDVPLISYVGTAPVAVLLPAPGTGRDCVEIGTPVPLPVGGQLDPETGLWYDACLYPPYTRMVGQIGPGYKMFGPAEPAWVAANKADGLDVSAMFFPVTAGGGYYWERTQPGELITLGIVIGARVGDLSQAITASVTTGFLSGVDAGLANCTKSWSRVANGGGSCFVGVPGQGGFSRSINTQAGWLSFSHGYGCTGIDPDTGLPVGLNCLSLNCGEQRGVPIRLRVWRPDKVAFPRRWIIQARFINPFIPTGSERGNGFSIISGSLSPAILISEQVDLNFDFECGGVAFWVERPAGSNEAGAGMFVHRAAIVPIGDLDTECEAPLPDELVLPTPTLEVTNDCGDISVAVDADTFQPAFTAINVEVRRVDTLASVYTGTETETGWTWPYGTPVLPLDVPLEMRVQYQDVAVTSEWSEWAGFIVERVFEDCVAQPCTVLVDVYEDDRTTIAWSVSDAPLADAPYLCVLENYGSQEIDVAAGAATIGQVDVTVIDKSQTRGDQDSGWLTERIQDVYGRRCRVRRFVDEILGWVTIADGPAGTPRLDDSYAAYRWIVKDTRETERKLRAFVDAGTTTIWPAGVLDGFGPVAATTPVLGHWTPTEFLGFITGTISFADYWAGAPGGPLQVVGPEVVIRPAAEVLTEGQSSTDAFGIQSFSYPNVLLLWRLPGEYDWNIYTPSRFVVGFPVFSWPLATVYDAKLADDTEVRAVYTIPTIGLGPEAPTVETDIEVVFLYRGEPTETTPYHIEGITLGELLQIGYDGLYSRRDDNDAVIDPGIRYDPAALALLTAPVRLRVTEPVPDFRAWAEAKGYAPTGWVPALDNDGQISPVSQIPPISFEAETLIENAITEPVPDWNAGERIINRIVFTYPRLYVPTTPPEALDGIAVREVVIDYLDPLSIRQRHGEQKIEYSGEAFAAIGDENGAATETELAATLAADRRLYVLDRYAYGAQAINVPVMRSATYQLRAGDWVRVDLSWFPNYDTGRRGMFTTGQIVAIEDLDCAWRRVLIEEVLTVEVGS